LKMEGSHSTEVEVVPPPEVWADAFAVEKLMLLPDVDDEAKPDADADADAEEPPVAVALAEELAEELTEPAIASLAPSIRVSDRQANIDCLTISIIGIPLFEIRIPLGIRLPHSKPNNRIPVLIYDQFPVRHTRCCTAPVRLEQHSVIGLAYGARLWRSTKIGRASSRNLIEAFGLLMTNRGLNLLVGSH
jgi:hypothetical protein